MRRLPWASIGIGALNLALQLGGYQNARLARVLWGVCIFAFFQWVIRHESTKANLEKIKRFRKRATAMTSFLVFVGGGIGVGAVLGIIVWLIFSVPQSRSAEPPAPEETAKPIPLSVWPIELGRDTAPLGIEIPPNSEAQIIIFTVDQKVLWETWRNSKAATSPWPIRPENESPKVDMMFKYQLINQGKSVVYNIRLRFLAEFYPPGKYFPKALGSSELVMEIGLLAPGTPFVFYGVNQSAYQVTFSNPETVTLQVEGESVVREVRLGQLIRNPIDAVPLPLDPTPFVWNGNHIHNKKTD